MQMQNITAPIVAGVIMLLVVAALAGLSIAFQGQIQF